MGFIREPKIHKSNPRLESVHEKDRKNRGTLYFSCDSNGSCFFVLIFFLCQHARNIARPRERRLFERGVSNGVMHQKKRGQARFGNERVKVPWCHGNTHRARTESDVSRCEQHRRKTRETERDDERKGQECVCGC